MVAYPDRLEDVSLVWVDPDPPSNPAEGDLWYDEANGDFYIYVDGAWNQLISGDDEVEVSNTEPVNPSVRVWIDPTTSPPTIQYLTEVGWEGATIDSGEFT